MTLRLRAHEVLRGSAPLHRGFFVARQPAVAFQSPKQRPGAARMICSRTTGGALPTSRVGVENPTLGLRMGRAWRMGPRSYKYPLDRFQRALSRLYGALFTVAMRWPATA